MQRKSVVSFDDAFEERAAKNVGKSFHKFIESTQRALASSSPLLFVGSGTLPIEYSSKSPLALVAHKQKLGDKEWFAAYTAFSDRYAELYGFEAAAKLKAKAKNGDKKPSGGKKPRASAKAVANDDADGAAEAHGGSSLLVTWRREERREETVLMGAMWVCAWQLRARRWKRMKHLVANKKKTKKKKRKRKKRRPSRREAGGRVARRRRSGSSRRARTRGGTRRSA